MNQHGMPSPAILVAVLALVGALAGTAVAGQDASTRTITEKKAITKKQVKKIATKQINKLAPGLSVAHADSAQTAANANTLDNLDSGSFAAADRFRFGSADHTATTPQTLFEAGGITVTTDGDSDLDTSVRIVNATGSNLRMSFEHTGSISFVGPGGATAQLYSSAGRAGTVVIREREQTQRALLIHCGSDFDPAQLACWGFLPPELAG